MKIIECRSRDICILIPEKKDVKTKNLSLWIQEYKVRVTTQPKQLKVYLVYSTYSFKKKLLKIG